MHTPRPGLTPEGYPYLGLFAFLTILSAILCLYWLTGLFVLCFFFCLNFFRDPVRYAPDDPDVVLSGADGKVCFAGRAFDPVEKRTRPCIGVFMNVFNVHVNRSPVAGEVKRVVYRPGKFFNASLDKASEDNERCSMVVETAGGDSFTVVQIAGLVARRIVCRAEVGDKLTAGQRFGCIMFGSRVDVYLPDEYELVLRIGDRAVAGETPLARRTGR